MTSKFPKAQVFQSHLQLYEIQSYLFHEWYILNRTICARLSRSKSKKFFAQLDPVEFRNGARPNIWYKAPAHQVVDPSFLLLTHTPDFIRRTPWHPRRLPRHSFPFYSLPPENPRDFLGFPETTDWKVAQHRLIARRDVVCVNTKKMLQGVRCTSRQINRVREFCFLRFLISFCILLVYF